MQITVRKKYSDTNKLASQPWHSKLEEVKEYFNRTSRADITSTEGFKSILANDGASAQYAKLVAGLVDDEDMQRTVESTILHSINDVKNPLAVPRSTEATDGIANNGAYSALARMNSWLIVGYAARSKCLELYHTISSDEPNISFTYDIDYVMYGNDKKKYFRPQADRDGDLGDLYTLPLLAPKESSGHAEKVAEQNTNGTDIWLKFVNNGLKGNFFDDNGEYSAAKYTLEKNPRITGVKYTITGSGEDEPSVETASGFMNVYFERKTATGEAQKKIFMEELEIPYTSKTSGAAKSVSATITGQVDLDSGDYFFTVIGPITHIQCEVRLTNVANELKTVRSGTISVTEDFSVDNHPYGTVPVVPEMSDDFNIGGEGVSAVAYFTDKTTSALANARDVTMERELDIAYTKGPKNATLYNKLGGFAGKLTFPLTARMAGGGDPFSWMKTGLKESIIYHLSNAEMATYFEDDTPRQWYILGADADVNRIPDVTYSHITDNDGIGGADARYGFQIKDRAGFMDSLDRRVRIIGSHYKRHYEANGQRIPMRAVLKSMDVKQPTAVYLPYSFRVYSGIINEYDHRTGLIVSARDCIKNLSCVQSRISLEGNTDNLYGAICSSNQSASAITFPAGTDTITIKATDEP